MRGLIVWLLLVCCSPMPAAELQGGAAVVEITPPVGHPLWGYAARKDAPSDGVLDPLKARALVLAAGDKKIAVVALDLGRAPTRQSMATIRKLVEPAGITHLFLVASHTHHGPVIELDNWPARDPYVRQLEKKLAEVIVAANKDLKPARIGVVAKEVGLNRNRQSKRADRPVDRELLVLRVETADGKPIAHAVNFAAHATLQDARLRKISADYPGVMALAVEKETGAPCLFLQGAAGDLSPNPEGEPGPEKFGQALAKEVLALIPRIRCQAAEKIQAAEDEFQFKTRLDVGNPVIKPLLTRAFFPELIDFYAREYKEGIRPHLTTALVDGKIGLVGVSGEFFSGQALSLKRRARLEHLLFLGYCNDYQQYFPTIEAAAEGGYGTEPFIAAAELGAGERIIDQALIRLYKMRGLVPDLPK